MEQVFPVGAGFSSLPPKGGHSGKGLAPSPGVQVGVVEKVLDQGNFIVVLEDGLKIKVRGSGTLKRGSKVRVQPAGKETAGVGASRGGGILKSVSEDGVQLSALIPLAFGGKKSNARLQVFVERQAEGGREQTDPAVYFVFTVQTEALGEVQWNIHMKGKQVTLQVFSQADKASQEGLRNLIGTVEKSLKDRGFILQGPTHLLNRPFQVPPGFRLNVRG